MPTSKDITDTFAKTMDQAFAQAVAQGGNYNELCQILIAGGISLGFYAELEDLKKRLEKLEKHAHSHGQT